MARGAKAAGAAKSRGKAGKVGAGKVGARKAKVVAQPVEIAKPAASVSVRPPKPRYCKKFALARLAEALPGIMQRLVHEAQQGSVPHLKMLVQLSGFDREVPKVKVREGKSLEALLKEDWKRADAGRGADGAGVMKDVEVWDQGWPGDRAGRIDGTTE